MNLENNKILHKTVIELLLSGQTVDVKAHGLSMFPLLIPTDTLRVIPCALKYLKRGQIIVFIKNEKLIAHRFIKMVHHQILCKGDALIKYDTLIAPEHYLGLISHRTRRARTISLGTPLRRVFAWISSWTTGLSGVFYHLLSRAWYKWFYDNK